MKTERSIANFDSASAMLRATASHLRGEDFPALGVIPRPLTRPMRGVGRVVNALPSPLQEQVYIWSGWNEAVPESKVASVDMERISAWAVNEYPDRKYTSAMIGSSNGANVHLCAAMGIPWLPQTFLIPVRRSGPHPDRPEEDIEWGVRPAREFLEANPDVVLHHMHDPNQDRLMVQRMCYFRAKKRRLGKAYEDFLLRNLQPGGTLYVVNCELSWPVVSVQDRHYFQFGALGGAEISEFMRGGHRVRRYLRRYDSEVGDWNPPEPDQERPEAEWGFDMSLLEDVMRFAGRHGFRVKVISFEMPEDFSPVVADFYREFNAERGVVGSRLLVESFILLEPHWALRTGSVPYWMFFNKEPSADAIETFLTARESFDEIYMTLFSHGVDSVGLAAVERWKRILQKAKHRGAFLGVDETSFPRDFAVLARFHKDLVDTISSRYPLPPPVDPKRVERFLEALPRRSGVKLEDCTGRLGRRERLAS